MVLLPESLGHESISDQNHPLRAPLHRAPYNLSPNRMNAIRQTIRFVSVEFFHQLLKNVCTNTEDRMSVHM